MEARSETIKRLRETLDVLSEAAPGITPEEYRAFLYIADNEGVSLKEVQAALGLPQSSTSRAVARLNGGLPGQAGGHGLIEAETDPDSRRKLRLHLSKQGRDLILRLSVIVGCLMAGPGSTIGDPSVDCNQVFGSMVTAGDLGDTPRPAVMSARRQQKA